MRTDVSTQRENSGQVGLENLIPILVRELVRSMSPLDTSAVEQDVDLISVGHDFGYDLLH